MDYIKILLKNLDINHLLNQSILEFKTEVSEKTGLISTKRIAEYHFCKVVIYDSGIVLFTGSIHKLWNSLNGIKAPNHREVKKYKGFNGNMLTIYDVFEVRNHLTKLFNCQPYQMIFQTIEVGVNTLPIFNPQHFIKGLLYHNGKPFEYRFNEHFAQAEHQRFNIKIYNKSNQYKMKNHVLRVELKIIKMEDIKCTGIKTFADINEHTLNKAKELLLKRFSEVVYYDYTIQKDSLTKRQKLTLKDYSNPRYWINELKPKNRDYNKNQLKYFIREYSSNLHKQTAENIVNQFGIINRVSDNYGFGIINHSSIGLNIPNNEHRKCPVTGYHLSHEKSDAKYICTTTLKHLRKHEKNIFIDLCSQLLKRSKKRPKYEREIIEHLAKQIRNRFYNQFKIKQTGYNQKIYPNQFRLTI
jgi:hypothetical protein